MIKDSVILTIAPITSLIIYLTSVIRLNHMKLLVFAPFNLKNTDILGLNFANKLRTIHGQMLHVFLHKNSLDLAQVWHIPDT